MEILLVDDNIEYLQQLKGILYSNGYTVYAAENGRQASEILSASQIDLLISDIQMPEMDGIELHSHTRAIERYKKMNFLFVSGFFDRYAENLNLDPECDYFFDKTVAPDELVQFIDRLLFGNYAGVWV